MPQPRTTRRLVESYHRTTIAVLFLSLAVGILAFGAFFLLSKSTWTNVAQQAASFLGVTLAQAARRGGTRWDGASASVLLSGHTAPGTPRADTTRAQFRSRCASVGATGNQASRTPT